MYVRPAERFAVVVVSMPSVSYAFAFLQSPRLFPRVLWILHPTFERRNNGSSRIHATLRECGGSTRVAAFCQWMTYLWGLVEEAATSFWQLGPTWSARILGNVYQVLDAAASVHRSW